MSTEDDLSQTRAAIAKRIQRSKLRHTTTVTLNLSPSLARVLKLEVEARGTNLKNYLERHLEDHFLQSDFFDLLEVDSVDD